MSSHPDLQASGQVHVAAERNLVSAVERIGTDIARWIGEVGSGGAEIVVSRRGYIAREGIRDLQVCVLDAGKRARYILLQAGLQAVVYRTPNGEEHFIRAHRIIDSGESRCSAGGTPAEHIP